MEASPGKEQSTSDDDASPRSLSARGRQQNVAMQLRHGENRAGRWLTLFLQ